MSAGAANGYTLFFIFPIVLTFGALYLFLWTDSISKEALKAAFFLKPFVLATLVLAGVVMHELLHASTALFFCKKGIKSIRFGIHWKSLTPYCHCCESMTVRQYRLVVAMPGLVMGLLPVMVGLYTGALGIMLFGLFFTLAAGGDLLILWLLRNECKNTLVQDHPTQIGCLIYE